MARLTQKEVDMMTCTLCDEAADVVVPREDKDIVVSLCRTCLREMLAAAEAPGTSH
jgi:hypothetical protein